MVALSYGKRLFDFQIFSLMCICLPFRSRTCRRFVPSDVTNTRPGYQPIQKPVRNRQACQARSWPRWKTSRFLLFPWSAVQLHSISKSWEAGHKAIHHTFSMDLSSGTRGTYIPLHAERLGRAFLDGFTDNAVRTVHASQRTPFYQSGDEQTSETWTMAVCWCNIQPTNRAREVVCQQTVHCQYIYRSNKTGHQLPRKNGS